MATRRMFSKKITDTDQFLDMPMSAQCLYFHLNMSADDDGFIGNAKTIRRMVGASEDDLKILLAKEFIIPFESGVVVIKDWKIHNYIQKDRYNETIYKSEKRLIKDDENGQYQRLEDMDTKCIQNVSKPDTQVRLGKSKVRLGKDRDSSSEEENKNHFDDDFEYPSMNAQRFYQENYGIAGSYIIQDIQHWVDDLTDEVVILALQKAIERDAPYSYAKSILKSWAKKNITTVEDAEAESYSNTKRKQKYSKSNSKIETLPDWVNNPQDDELLSEEEESEFKEKLQKIRAKKGGG